MRGLGDAAYRLILLAFPRSFRERYGLQMEAQFRAQRANLGVAPQRRPGLWVRAALDAAAHGWAIRREAYAAGRAARPRSTFARAWLAFPQDVRFAARGVVRGRSFATVVVVTLTLGIAANAIMFGLVDQLLLRGPAGVGHPADVRRVYLGTETPDRQRDLGTKDGYPLVSAIRDGVPAFSSASVVARASVTLDAGANARRATIDLVNAGYFEALELRPAAGRFFSRAEDDATDAAPVVVVSHAFWNAELGRDPAAVGRILVVEGRPLTIIGVTPEGFAGIEDSPASLWAPLGTLAGQLVGDNWATWPGNFQFGVVGRLAPDATDASATSQATAAYRSAYDGFANLPFFDPLVTATTIPLRRLEAPNGLLLEGRLGLWLMGVAAVVMLVAMANVANLLLARALARRREIGIRLALGVSRIRLLRQFFIEAALLALLAGAIALSVASVGGRLVRDVLLPGFVWQPTVVDGRLLSVTLLLATLTALGAGLAPAVYALSTDLMSRLHAAGRVATGRLGGVRSGLVIAQVALSAVSLVGAGLFVRSLQHVAATDVGIDLNRVILGVLPVADRPDAERIAIYELAAERLRGIPGLESVVVTGGNALAGGTTAMRWFIVEGETPDALSGRHAPTYSVTPPGYFGALGSTFVRGRAFSPDEYRQGTRVAVVEAAMAAQYWPGIDPIGQCIYLMDDEGRPCTRVVGMVENISTGRLRERSGRYYLLPTHPVVAGDPPTGLTIRTSGAAATSLPAVRQALQSLTADMPVVRADTAAAMLEPELRPWRVGSAIFTTFGLVALVISAIGLYSALAYLVSQRTHEIGVRMALGASRRQVVARIASYGAALVGTGIVVGLLMAVATRWLPELLYQTSPRDPWVFGVVALTLAGAGGVAAIVPARRSTGVDPLVVLKAD